MFVKPDLIDGIPSIAILDDQKKEVAKAQFTANELDALISALAQMRASIAPPFPDSPVGLTLDTTVAPAYWTERDPLSEETVLFFRNNGLGWLGFLLPEQAMRHLISLWEKQLQTPRSSAGPKN